MKTMNQPHWTGKPETTQQVEVPVEDVTVMPVSGPKKIRRRDRHLTTERREGRPAMPEWHGAKGNSQRCLYQAQCDKRNPERIHVREEMSVETGM
jgi:hypothetical protein